jgi:hypothetical protein
MTKSIEDYQKEVADLNVRIESLIMTNNNLLRELSKANFLVRSIKGDCEAHLQKVTALETQVQLLNGLKKADDDRLFTDPNGNNVAW